MSDTGDWRKDEELRVVVALGILAALLALIQYWGNNPNQSLIHQFLPVSSSGPIFEAQIISIVLVLGFFGLYMLFMVFATSVKTFHFTRHQARIIWLAHGFYLAGGVCMIVGVVLEILRVVATLW